MGKKYIIDVLTHSVIFFMVSPHQRASYRIHIRNDWQSCIETKLNDIITLPVTEIEDFEQVPKLLILRINNLTRYQSSFL